MGRVKCPVCGKELYHERMTDYELDQYHQTICKGRPRVTAIERRIFPGQTPGQTCPRCGDEGGAGHVCDEAFW